MTGTTYIKDIDDDYVVLHTLYGEYKLHRHTLSEINTVIAGHLGGKPLNTQYWNGLVTTIKDRTETVYGWFGDYSSAEYVAGRIFAKGGADGTRAYALIRQFGRDVDTERTFNFDVGDDTDGGEDDGEDTQTAPSKRMLTLDNWGE